MCEHDKRYQFNYIDEFDVGATGCLACLYPDLLTAKGRARKRDIDNLIINERQRRLRERIS